MKTTASRASGTVPTAANAAPNAPRRNRPRWDDLPVADDTANLRVGPDLHDAVHRAAAAGRGVARRGRDDLPDADGAVAFGQQIVFAHDGGPFLSYESRTWLLDDGGAIRPRPAGGRLLATAGGRHARGADRAQHRARDAVLRQRPQPHVVGDGDLGAGAHRTAPTVERSTRLYGMVTTAISPTSTSASTSRTGWRPSRRRSWAASRAERPQPADRRHRMAQPSGRPGRLVTSDVSEPGCSAGASAPRRAGPARRRARRRRVRRPPRRRRLAAPRPDSRVRRLHRVGLHRAGLHRRADSSGSSVSGSMTAVSSAGDTAAGITGVVRSATGSSGSSDDGSPAPTGTANTAVPVAVRAAGPTASWGADGGPTVTATGSLTGTGSGECGVPGSGCPAPTSRRSGPLSWVGSVIRVVGPDSSPSSWPRTRVSSASTASRWRTRSATVLRAVSSSARWRPAGRRPVPRRPGPRCVPCSGSPQPPPRPPAGSRACGR